jgi:hypothetical protein
MNRLCGHHPPDSGTLAFATETAAANVLLREALFAFEIQNGVTPRAITAKITREITRLCSFVSGFFAQRGHFLLLTACGDGVSWQEFREGFTSA